ncbi:MAG: hypothetical protein GC162_14120 [Planctomycetes bacterium]|nr:hypothetical protein [Planctomycetota bacterium]
MRNQRTSLQLAIAAAASIALGASAHAAIQGPYVADAHTLHLYHFDESSGALMDSGMGTTLNIPGTTAGTGGADGRNHSTSGGYSAAAFSGFGNAFNMLNAGSGGTHSTASGVGGGTLGPAADQAEFQAANGAFTIEALVNIANIDTGSTNEQTIFSHDSATTRGGAFRILNGTLALYNGQASGTTSVGAAIPTTGPNAFVANEWFHVAVTYTGEATANNVSFYWTRLDGGATEANFIGSATIGGDMNAITTAFGLGGTSRSPYRFELRGLMDELRISDVVLNSHQFLFVPTPAALPAGLALMGLVTMRRRK